MYLGEVRRVAIVGVAVLRSPVPTAPAHHRLRPGGARRTGRDRRAVRLREPGAVGVRGRRGPRAHSGPNLARETVLGSGLDPRTPAYDIQQACGTGVSAVVAADTIALGAAHSAVAGGADTASDAPLAVEDDLRGATVRRPAREGTRWPPEKTLSGVRPSPRVPDIPRNAEPRTGLSMGEHAAITARKRGTTREDQDALAAGSRRRLAGRLRAGVPARSPRRSGESPGTRTCAPVRRPRNSPRSSRCSARTTTTRRRPRAIRRRSPTGRRSCCSPLRGGRRPAGVRSWPVSRRTRRQRWTAWTGRGAADGAGPRGPRGCWSAPVRGRRTSASSRSTRPSPRRSSPRSRPGRSRDSPRWTARGSMSRGLAGDRPPVRGHRRPDRRDPSPRSSRSGRGPARGLISLCAAGGQGVTAILERP